MPGPFSLGAPGVAEAAYERAGLVDVTVTPVESPVRMASAQRSACSSSGTPSARCTRCSPRVTDEERAAAWREIEETLEQFEGPDGFVGPCEMLVVSGATR